eukprot:1781825-Amphidinium_carterae.1
MVFLGVSSFLETGCKSILVFQRRKWHLKLLKTHRPYTNRRQIFRATQRKASAKQRPPPTNKEAENMS